MDDKQKFQLDKWIHDLEGHRARHTELVSVYVPQGYDVQKIINQISQEAGTARNIKSATTRKNVTDALEKMIRELRIYKKTPDNGLAVFSGNVSKREGVSDVNVWSFEPPEPVRTKAYRCGQTFFLEPLQNMLDIADTYGLIVLDRREADLATLKGTVIEPVTRFKSVVPGKFKAGGQSAARFSRVIENLAKDFFKKVGDKINIEFTKEKGLKGIILGGPGPTKENFLKGNFLSQDIKDQIIGTVDIGYTGEDGIAELVMKSQDLLVNEEIIREKKAIERLLNVLHANPKKVAYGRDPVQNALNMNAVDFLLISESIPKEDAVRLSKLAEAQRADWIVISKNSHEGHQLEGLGSMAAILRFSID